MLAYQHHVDYGLHVVRVRPFNHIGPRQAPEFAISGFAKQIAESEAGHRAPVIAVGNLGAKRDLTDVRDVVLAYWLGVRNGEPGEVYNVCSQVALPMREILDRLLAMSSRKITVEQDRERLRSSDVPLVLGNCAKFRKLTGWSAETPLDKALRDTLGYWRHKSLEAGSGASLPS
jgi:GDP-4-dehydro-6-deoxy-D-mannose reductase